jgi:hypothetical protein
MAYTKTLQDAIDEGAFANVAGVCLDSTEFRGMVNESQRRLIKRGNWFGTEVLVHFCLYSGCITLPRYIGTLLGIRFCGMDAPEIKNGWYDIAGPGSCSCTHTVTEIGTATTYNAISGTIGKYIRYSADKLEDLGKTITIYGLDANNQPLQERVGGIWQRGLTLTLVAPHAQTTILARKITSVIREATQANCRLYEVDSVGGYVRDLALYEPSETNPRYRQYRINGFQFLPTGCSEVDGIKLRKVTAMVKLAFVPVMANNDFLVIDDFDAIKFMLQAIRREEAGEDAQAEVSITKAIREMNFTERDKKPGQTTVVRVNATGYMRSPI